MAQAHVEYAGGTLATMPAGVPGILDVSDDHYLALYAKKNGLRIAYTNVNGIEYGQQVDRRVAMAVVISPLLVLAKSRKHFLTIEYVDEFRRQQAVVFRVDKNSIRPTLASLEARTGQRVRYQDEEARKGGVN